MDIGGAIKALKEGKRVTRPSWNGSGQFVYYIPPSKAQAQTDTEKEIAGEDGTVFYGGYLILRTSYGTLNTWVPSISDLLAEDWHIV